MFATNYMEVRLFVFLLIFAFGVVGTWKEI